MLVDVLIKVIELLRIAAKANGISRARLQAISDDGDGDPAQLRTALRVCAVTDLSGQHRGLANMQTRVRELDGTMSIRRSKLGGIMVLFEVPMPLTINGRRAG